MAIRSLATIDTIIIHCSATTPAMDISVEDIDKWHKERGWDMIGYHYFVDLKGDTHQGRSIETIGAHAKGNNHNSIGICYAGGVDENQKPADTLTKSQRDAISNLIISLGLILQKPLKVIGHNELSTKACPSFDVAEKFAWEIEQLNWQSPPAY